MAQLAWHTSVSILVAGGMVAGAVYLALRPSASSEPAVEVAELAVQAPNRSDPSSPMVERDRQRRWAEAEAERDQPGAQPQRRGGEDLSEAELAMAVAPPLLGVPGVPQTLNERVQHDASEAFEGIRESVRATCWDGAPDDPEAPDSVNVMLSLSYGADGKLLASGVSEDREHHRKGLAACLTPFIHELDVPAPGSNLSVDLRVSIP